MSATLWIRVRREARDGRAARVLEVSDADGVVRHVAVAFPWLRDIEVAPVPGLEGEHFTIRRRRSFPLTGRVDAIGANGGRFGILARSRIVRGPDGREVVRFRDARSRRDRTGETLFELAGQIITGAEGGDPGRAPLDYRILAGGRSVGRLARASWPFPDGTPAAPPEIRGWRRFLPAAVRDLARRLAAPECWRADLLAAPDVFGGERLRLASLVWTVELSHW